MAMNNQYTVGWRIRDMTGQIQWWKEKFDMAMAIKVYGREREMGYGYRQ